MPGSRVQDNSSLDQVHDLHTNHRDEKNCRSRPFLRHRERDSDVGFTPGLTDNPDVVRESSPLVLVLDDDTAGRHPLVKFLQMRQYNVVTADTADEGLRALRQHRPDAAIVDVCLKQGSGRDVVVSMPPEIPVIIVSRSRSEWADLEAIRPPTRVVEKPYSLIMLMDTLEDMLEQARTR